MQAETISLRSDAGDDIEAYFARPLGPGPYGSVVVIHHMPGYDRATKEIVRTFAVYGYAALCPNLFHRYAREDSIIGAAYVFSFETGKVLRRFTGADHLSGFGEVVAAVGDLDGDAKGEVLVSAPRTNDQTRTRAGDVYAYSGATGAQLRHWTGTQPG